MIDAKNINNEITRLNDIDCLIIDRFENNVDEKILYSILNQSRQLENYVLINSTNSIKNNKFSLNDLQSRINSFIYRN